MATNHAAPTWAEGVRRLVEEDYPEAQRITLVMDNLSTHTGASLYKTFEPERARALLDKLEFVYTPKHGSWLNIAECEFSVLSRQCLDRHRHAAQRSKRLDGTAQSDEQASGLALYHR